VLFTRCSDLWQRLQAARRDLRLPQELAKLDRFDLLILGDLSYVRCDQAETSVFWRSMSSRSVVTAFCSLPCPAIPDPPDPRPTFAGASL
jgi:DNA replication protein DnaC